MARPSSPADSTTVIAPSPTKEETEDEAPVCVYTKEGESQCSESKSSKNEKRLSGESRSKAGTQGRHYCL